MSLIMERDTASLMGKNRPDTILIERPTTFVPPTMKEDPRHVPLPTEDKNRLVEITWHIPDLEPASRCTLLALIHLLEEGYEVRATGAYIAYMVGTGYRHMLRILQKLEALRLIERTNAEQHKRKYHLNESIMVNMSLPIPIDRFLGVLSLKRNSSIIRARRYAESTTKTNEQQDILAALQHIDAETQRIIEMQSVSYVLPERSDEDAIKTKRQVLATTPSRLPQAAKTAAGRQRASQTGRKKQAAKTKDKKENSNNSGE